jgi:hypothetical protein
MLFITHDDRLSCACRHEDFDGRIVIAIRALVERAFNAGGMWPIRQITAGPGAQVGPCPQGNNSRICGSPACDASSR